VSGLVALVADTRSFRPRNAGLPQEITEALVALWTRYAGKPPADARTEVRGNVVTCVLVDAVGNFDERTADPHRQGAFPGARKPTLADYKRDAVAAIVGLTRQRVAAFLSSHDRDTDVATEIFTLEPSLGRGRPGLTGTRLALMPLPAPR
jgi:hypothetical protein